MLQFLLTSLLIALLGVGAALLIEKVQRGTTRAVRGRLQFLYQRFGGLVSFFGAAVLWFASAPLLKAADPNTSPFDLGWVQTILMSTMRLLVFLGLTQFFIGYYWPVVGEFLRKRFDKSFQYLTHYQKCVFSACLFFALLFAFIQLTH